MMSADDWKQMGTQLGQLVQTHRLEAAEMEHQRMRRETLAAAELIAGAVGRLQKLEDTIARSTGYMHPFEAAPFNAVRRAMLDDVGLLAGVVDHLRAGDWMKSPKERAAAAPATL